MKIKIQGLGLVQTIRCLGWVLLFLNWSVFADVFQVKVIDVNGMPLNGIVVYVETSITTSTTPAKNGQAEANYLVISQKDKQFTPYITVIQKGSEVEFVNQDDITHHIYSAIGKNKFSFKLKAEEVSNKILFAHSGTVPMGCNIHDWMSGHILVVDTPLFSVTNDQGVAQLTPPENGQAEVFIWHPQLAEKDKLIKKTINLAKDKLVNIQLSFAMLPIPKQKGLDDFDFLDGY